MTTQTSSLPSAQSRFARPLIVLVLLFVLSSGFLLAGGVLMEAQGIDVADIMKLRWLPYLLVGGLLAYGCAVLVPDNHLWTIRPREGLAMAGGALLYGVLSWTTNIVEIPGLTLLSFRPAIVIPIFFGMVFGPIAGFVTGFAGNVLGDALSGWGVFPNWDIGNGLIGLIAGLAPAISVSRRRLNLLTGSIVALHGALFVLLALFPETQLVFTSGSASKIWWLPLVVVIWTVGTWALLRRQVELAFAQMWGALAIIVGMGFAAIADIWWSNFSFVEAVLTEFIPAGGSNLVNALILLPIVLMAWNMARSQPSL